MAVTPNAIADCVLSTFDSLPAKCKPRPRYDNAREWTPLSGIVLCKDGEMLTCVALGTGAKCLPLSKIPRAKGTILHDWHAEVLAIRSFNLFLIQECVHLLDGKQQSDFIRRRTDTEITKSAFQPFEINDNIEIYMYCSEAPCGDASMELVMGAQDDPTPWAFPQPAHLSVSGGISTENSTILSGRGYFSEVGIVRRKPSRPDAPPTLSKSCSDKLALKQCTSLLNCITSLLFHPGNAYIYMLVLPSSQYVPKATDRAFGPDGRMLGINDAQRIGWPDGYSFRPFAMKTTEREFAWSRRNGEGREMIPCNLSAVYTPYCQETLVGGVLQGRKQSDFRAASRTSRRGLLQLLQNHHSLRLVLPKGSIGLSYTDLKNSSYVCEWRKVKDDVKAKALRGWVSNQKDEAWSLN
ncbi:hypothetical protein M501DRAFT_1061698 [Patellaria atrata CBS 101060]|uniref:A to I editase domain-containing protein n=1 Tax=Patellaria atrata CBS 101060 TaxID=1346257 RepID=A0A9P4S1N8_9PEZI|nr:hypothetical protein M501DRAFT_1061698 [Patellaria atrata CBS 101060]